MARASWERRIRELAARELNEMDVLYAEQPVRLLSDQGEGATGPVSGSSGSVSGSTGSDSGSSGSTSDSSGSASGSAGSGSGSDSSGSGSLSAETDDESTGGGADQAE